MNMGDVKLYALNLTALSVSMTNIENYLKVLLLLVSIGYTLSKWVGLKQEDKEEEKDK
jgi:hypothetical protein|tara:strand:- start:744 stop:917 length:174 start_codon:yes stop_codon:yes gene_type:complete